MPMPLKLAFVRSLALPATKQDQCRRDVELGQACATHGLVWTGGGGGAGG